MSKCLISLQSLVLVVVMAIPLAAQDRPDADTVIANVNGDEITLGHVISMVATLPPNYAEIEDDVLYELAIEQLIQQLLLAQQQDGLTRMNRLELENEDRSRRAAQTVNSLLEGALTDESIRAAYDAQFADFQSEEEFNASHILVETEAEAMEIKALLDDGADFAEMAQQKSTGPSGPNGGSLGWFGKGRMVPEFENAVVAMEKGQISEPVQTQFGWHLIILNDKRKSELPEFNAVRDQLAQSIQQEMLQAKIIELTQAAQIERPALDGVNPEVIRQIDLLEE